MRSILLLSCGLAASPALGAQLAPVRSAPVLRSAPALGGVLGGSPLGGGISALSSSHALSAPAGVLYPLAAPALDAAPAALTALGAFTPESALAPSFSAERASLDGALRFDGARLLEGGAEAPSVYAGPSGQDAGGWSQGSFLSPVDEAVLHFKRRASDSQEKRPPMVFVGGLGLSESFDAMFAAQPARSDQVFLWLRGNAPSPWAAARHPMDVDARDLARMIVTAAEQAGSSRVELALHSYASLVFQRMLQMEEQPEVRQALGLLRGSRVFLLNATTHFKGSESAAGPEYEKMTQATKMLVGWLDMMESAAALWRQTPIWSPAFPAAQAWLMSWDFQRGQALELAAKGVVAQLRDHLKGPWAPEVEESRLQAVARLERNAHDAGWQEALVRRVNDGALLEAQAGDVARMAELGIRSEVVVSHDDQIIPWSVSKVFLAHLGVAAPDAVPPAGTVLRSRDGLVTVRIVAGDHYVPLKSPALIDGLIAR
ncbi:MAG: hypothetical protein AAB320_05165 [Elusimicrobiota bacterium]